jgi:hypothetical protein
MEKKSKSLVIAKKGNIWYFTLYKWGRVFYFECEASSKKEALEKFRKKKFSKEEGIYKPRFKVEPL